MKTLSVESSLIKAKSLSKKGRIEESINILQLALNNFPNNIRVQKTLQNLTTSNNNFADKKIPENELNKLYNLYNSIETNKFLFEAERILKQYPDAFMVWNLMGIVRAKNGSYFWGKFKNSKVRTISREKRRFGSYGSNQNQIFI